MPVWFLPLALAAAGALADKEKPLRGAALGAGLGFGGAALAPGLLGGAAGAGSAATGAATGAAEAGLLGAGGATAGIAPGATQAGMLAAQEAGLGASSLGWGGATTGIQGGINGMLGAETGSSVGGLLGSAEKIAKPVGQAMQVSQQMAGNEPQIQAPPPPQLPAQNMDMSGLIGQGQQMRQYDAQEAERRKQLMAMYANNIGRGMG